MRRFGLIVCCALLAAPLLHFAPLLATKSLPAVFSQYLGFAALIAMAQIMVLATRWPGVELVYGGLDRVYLLHKWLGIIAVAAVLLHEAIDPEIKGMEFGGRFEDLAEDVAELSYNGLLALVAITLITFIPYHWWRASHKLMGAVFAAAAFHAYFIEKSFSNSSPMGLYILALSVLGLVAYFYTLMPVRWMRRMRPYKVTGVENTGQAISVTLVPEKKGLRHHAGQFAFVGLDSSAHSEIHPFTISKAPNSNHSLRFTIKPLGAGTEALVDALKTGQTAQVSQAFGHFRYRQTGQPQIWVAGGIGITPFLAWADDLKADHEPIHLFVCCRTRDDVAHLSELYDRAASDPSFHVHLCESRAGQRLSIDLMREHVPNLPRSVVSFCGGENMRESLRKDLLAAGVKRANFRYEEFKIRSGLPLALAWRCTSALFRRLRLKSRPASYNQAA
ncbi:MAG: hypothetical protein GY948_10745 [Alphaproteobacteria bacterium]|nr:hypothetical protein [Alphaproteobacteria bacterium]